MTSKLHVKPLTADTFRDLEALFAQKGCSFARDCWCMGYRLSGKVTPPEGKSLKNYRKQLIRKRAKQSPAAGLIGYDADGDPVGWVSFGPREEFARLKRSPVMKPVDDTPVWSIVCFVVPSPHRGQGVAAHMLDHAVIFAKENGATAIEAYPIDKPERSAPQFLWFGVPSMFEKAGFVEIARRKPERPVMRLMLA